MEELTSSVAGAILFIAILALKAADKLIDLLASKLKEKKEGNEKRLKSIEESLNSLKESLEKIEKKIK